jgi:hypothetical protein
MALASQMKSKSATLKTRKPIDQLSVGDLVAFPIWEFATDEEDSEGQDETWVRPVDARSIRKGLWSLSVATDYHTRAGASIAGFIGVSTAEGVEIDNAVLLPKGKYIFVDVRSPASRRATAKALGLSVKDVFPLKFTLRVPIGREKTFRTGVIE